MEAHQAGRGHRLSTITICRVIVLGDNMLGPDQALTTWILPVGAFCGALVSTGLLYLLATRGGQISVAVMRQAGIALRALTSALTGLLVTISNDHQLWDLTFWSVGGLGGATWTKLAIAAIPIVPVIFAVPFLARSLNALSVRSGGVTLCAAAAVAQRNEAAASAADVTRNSIESSRLENNCWLACAVVEL